MSPSILALALTLSASVGQAPSSIKQVEIDYQNEVFQRWWESDLVWEYDVLPKEGQVPRHRLPYSGHDYPDRAGGTINVLQKYDRAFNRGDTVQIETGNQPESSGGRRRIFAARPVVRTVGSASAFEHHDTTAFTEPTVERRGLFGLRRVTVQETPHWHGHCNGWTAAAIRHAEPQTNVTRNGVVFTPADIKGLLAEIYMYRDNEFLGGEDAVMNPGLLHVVLANWLGRGDHPVGIETAVGKEKWNYPLYAFKTSFRKLSDREVEVRMNANYSLSTRREVDRSQHLAKTIHFHYSLKLDAEGKIVGGSYYNDSARIDMLWTPLHPVQGGTPGNERGNPHLDVKEVLAIWRESVPEEIRGKWWNIDPTEEDALVEKPESTNADAAGVAAAEGAASELPAAAVSDAVATGG